VEIDCKKVGVLASMAQESEEDLLMKHKKMKALFKKYMTT